MGDSVKQRKKNKNKKINNKHRLVVVLGGGGAFAVSSLALLLNADFVAIYLFIMLCFLPFSLHAEAPTTFTPTATPTLTGFTYGPTATPPIGMCHSPSPFKA